MRYNSVMHLLYTVRVKTCLNLFFSLVWMCLLIYYMLGQLLNDRKLHHRHLQKDIFFNGEPSSIMAELGFVGEPKYYPQDYHDKESLPIFVLPLQSADMEGFFAFLFSFRKFYPSKILVIYDLDLADEELQLVKNHCKCMVRLVHWSRYPKHVRNLKHKAYLPLLIQEALQEFGVIFLCDASMRFISSALSPDVSTQAFTYNFTVWSSDDAYPTSTFTHYNMFRFFDTSHENFYFHRMSDPSKALYIHTQKLQEKLMLPWVKCVLDYDCLNPIGAQPFGCNFLHKPKYIYAGCHSYDTAAFNVLAGLMFEFDAPYICKKSLFYIERPSLIKRASDNSTMLLKQALNATNQG